MTRLARFDDYRFVGDRATQRVYDTDELSADEVEALEKRASENLIVVFSPDELSEARNRGYRLRDRVTETS